MNEVDTHMCNEICWTTGEHSEGCDCGICKYREECLGPGENGVEA